MSLNIFLLSLYTHIDMFFFSNVYEYFDITFLYHDIILG